MVAVPIKYKGTTKDTLPRRAYPQHSNIKMKSYLQSQKPASVAISLLPAMVFFYSIIILQNS